MKLQTQNISKKFNGRSVLRDLSVSVEKGQSLAITGPNGSGKTTFMRILCGLMQADSGDVTYEINTSTLPLEKRNEHIGLVGPYIQLYQELTAFENLEFVARLKSIDGYQEKIFSLMAMLGLKGREHDQAKTYSSGMKQRLKYAFALLAQPSFLFIDEPTSNLDKTGIETIYEIMRTQKQKGILVFATNDAVDLKLADEVYTINA